MQFRFQNKFLLNLQLLNLIFKRNVNKKSPTLQSGSFISVSFLIDENETAMCLSTSRAKTKQLLFRKITEFRNLLFLNYFQVFKISYCSYFNPKCNTARFSSS
jgi:hypothetical protein